MKFDPQIVAQANEFEMPYAVVSVPTSPLCVWNTGSSSWPRYTPASVWRDVKPAAP